MKGRRTFHSLGNESEPDKGLYSRTEDLTLSDRDDLQALLDRHAEVLPLLHPEMSSNDVQDFLIAFRAISDRRMPWEPDIYSKESRQGYARRRLDLYTKHAKKLQAEVKQKKIRLFDADRIPLDELHVPSDSFLTKEHSQAYLERLGLSFEDVMHGESVRDGRQGCNDDVHIADGIERSDTPINEESELAPPVGGSANAAAVAPPPEYLPAVALTACATPDEGGTTTPGARRPKRKWTDKEKEIVVLLYKNRLIDEGAQLFEGDEKKFKQYAKRWKEKYGVGDEPLRTFMARPTSLSTTVFRDGQRVENVSESSL